MFWGIWLQALLDGIGSYCIRCIIPLSGISRSAPVFQSYRVCITHVFFCFLQIYGAAVADNLDRNRGVLSRRYFRQVMYGNYEKPCHFYLACYCF